MPRIYCILDENQCEIDCVHPEDYAALLSKFKIALELIDEVFTHGNSIRWSNRAGDFLERVEPK